MRRLSAPCTDKKRKKDPLIWFFGHIIHQKQKIGVKQKTASTWRRFFCLKKEEKMKKEMGEEVFDPAHMIILMDRTGLTIEELAAQTGISAASIAHVRTGQNVSVKLMKTLASYFGVSVGYLLGEETGQSPEEVFHAFSVARQKEASRFEDTIQLSKAGRKWPAVYRGITAGWPYNLTDLLDMDHEEPHRIPVPLTADQMADLEYAIGMLTEQEQNVIRMCFTDGYTLEEAGEKYSVTRERIR